MSAGERDAIVEGVRELIRGSQAITKLGGGGAKTMLAVMAWFGRQIAMERSHAQMLEAFREKCRKVGPHVDAIVRAL